ncbi:MAG: hypothetical protein PHH82_00085 [Candidatus ainarchaeum sp.]|nr:hypothetical protein [Candidatus ainarchaeum sp.]
MVLDKTIVKDSIKKIEKNLTKSRKTFSEMEAIITYFQEVHKYFDELKSKTTLSNEDKKVVGQIIKTTALLENYGNFYSDLIDLQSQITSVSLKLREVALFLETYRTIRKYKVQDPQKIFAFLSGSLDGFAESYIFKPEFIGDMKTDDFVKKLGVAKDGPYLRASYTVLPKLIEYAYSQNMKNFVIESHNLKLIFHRNYVITVYTENEMIKKIDRVARDLEISFD